VSKNPRGRSPDQAFDFESDYGSAYEKLAYQLIPAYAELFHARASPLRDSRR